MVSLLRIKRIYNYNLGLPYDEANDICRNFDGDEYDFTFCDERDAMLICAYIEVIVPWVSLLLSFVFVARGDSGPVLFSNIPGLVSVAAGAIYLTMYYGGKCVFPNNKSFM